MKSLLQLTEEYRTISKEHSAALKVFYDRIQPVEDKIKRSEMARRFIQDTLGWTEEEVSRFSKGVIIGEVPM